MEMECHVNRTVILERMRLIALGGKAGNFSERCSCWRTLNCSCSWACPCRHCHTLADGMKEVQMLDT
ncbi:hypothetical protein AQUCO_05900049v1 [Aquilegia coerulea]|uniref:Uncharacterized protein n=1 Tax=Aquilegia coerulea TaxID=218851 RepID=A0A2G5CE38_AQUCA|nr:hypothetical protein AQUCO_05900049v1 [Aquilegia coerulea]